MFFRRDDDVKMRSNFELSKNKPNVFSNVKSFAISQIFILIFSLFSFTFLIGESNLASGQGGIDGERDKPQFENSPPAKGGLGAKALAPQTYTYSITEGSASLSGATHYKVYADGTAEFFGADGKSIPSYGGRMPLGELEAEIEGAGAKSEQVINQAETGFYGRNPFGWESGFTTNLISGLIWGATAYGVVYLLGDYIGLDNNEKEAAAAALGIGTTIGRFGFLQAQGGTGFFSGLGFGSNAGLGVGGGAILWTIGIAAVTYLILYRGESQQIYNFQCLPYEAPVGGKDCEACNNDPYRPCSEYRCRALGQACELVNVGSTEEKCIWVNPNDALSPTITPWTTPLTENHRYTNHDTRPTSLGTKIVKNGATNGCLQAFTPLTFGITTNEPAQCKMDLDHKNSFDEMQFFFGNTNLYLYNHTQQFSLPSPGSLNDELPELQANGKYDFFVRCRDKNGNENVDEFAIQLCVDPSPDTTAPVIVDTSIPSGSFVKYQVGSVPVQFYVNEPSTCKWSTQDKSYDVMENSMTCATSLTQVNARELYTCQTNLTGIVDRKENNFFIRCKDQPKKPEEERNVNVVSYKYDLIGSQPLNIIFVGPNGTVTGNTNTIPVNLKVITDDGASEGVSICAFSSTGLPNSFIPMFETRSVEHTQRLDLTSGDYKYYIRCSDFGGNSAEAEIVFLVSVDTFSPLVTRAYRDSSNEALKIVTNEDAECKYSLNSCNFNFEEGIEMLYISTSNKKSHYSEWKPNLAYYIKCRDVFGNEPGPNTCSLVASATNIGQK